LRDAGEWEFVREHIKYAGETRPPPGTALGYGATFDVRKRNRAVALAQNTGREMFAMLLPDGAKEVGPQQVVNKGFV